MKQEVPMFRLFDIVYENCLFRQFKVNDLLFVEYKCLNNEQKLKVLSLQNFFIYILGGKKIWQTLQSRYEATDGQAVFVKKGANIVSQFYDKEFCALIIFIPDEFIINTIQHSGLDLSFMNPEAVSDSVVPLEADPVLNAYFQSVFSYFGQEQRPPAALLELKFKELILYILSSAGNQKLASYLFSLCRSDKTCFVEVMEKNFIYNLTLEEFAQLAGRSLAAFKREFKLTYKITPGRWLMQKRLEYAKRLLENSDKNINELSFDSGFESASHFVKTFKANFNITPLQYRKRIRT